LLVPDGSRSGERLLKRAESVGVTTLAVGDESENAMGSGYLSRHPLSCDDLECALAKRPRLGQAPDLQLDLRQGEVRSHLRG
jgi:hypothetical protein